MSNQVFECGSCGATQTATRPQACHKCHAGPLLQRLYGEVALPGLEGCDREAATARGEAEAEDLTAILRSPKADVSAKAGRMERESPLFFGMGENPLLF